MCVVRHTGMCLRLTTSRPCPSPRPPRLPQEVSAPGQSGWGWRMLDAVRQQAAAVKSGLGALFNAGARFVDRPAASVEARLRGAIRGQDSALASIVAAVELWELECVACAGLLCATVQAGGGRPMPMTHHHIDTAPPPHHRLTTATFARLAATQPLCRCSSATCVRFLRHHRR